MTANVKDPPAGAGLSGHRSFQQNDLSRSKKPHRKQHPGGNRLDHFRQLLVGDQRTVEALPDSSSRKRPTVARLRFLGEARP